MLIGSPVGTPDERAAGKVWPGSWIDANHFNRRYVLRKDKETGEDVWARHTGADLNLPGNADKDTPIFAIADGIVTASKKLSGGWGWVIVIEHKDDEGQLFYSRYAHVNHIQFPVAAVGEQVAFGSAIAHVGDADGVYSHHLHFDISHTETLKSRPWHWPGDVSEEAIKQDYSDPRQFIIKHRTG